MMRSATISAFLALAALVCASACSRAHSKPTAGGKKVIVIGVDGMDPVFLEKHWDSLPNLAKLSRQGEFKRLGTTMPPQSPVAWSTFITGLDPAGHGIYDFIHRDPKTMAPVSSMSETTGAGRTLNIGPWVLPLSQGHVESFRQGKAFWQILSERGVPVNIIRMPTNFPPVDSEGESLSGMGTPDMRGTFGTFTFFTDNPEEKRGIVPGGQVVKVKLENYRAVLRIEGPANTLRKDQAKTAVELTAQVDPAEGVARFELGSTRLLLRQGEWSGWLHAPFPLIPWLKDAAGMFRIYAKQLHPGFQIYISPINIDPEHPELPISDPDTYSRDLAKSIGPFYTQGMAEDTAAFRQGIFTREDYLAQSRLVAEEHLALLRQGIRNFQSGLFFFHFFGVDQNSHMLWGKFDDDLLKTYQRVDRELGWVMENMGDATLIVMSDHGFSTFDRAVHVNTWLMREGFLTLTDSSKVGDEELFPYVDWSKTQAYSLGLNGLYLNLLGRERDGVVAAGADAEAVLEKISKRMLEFRDPDTGVPVVDTLYAPAKIFKGKHLEHAPDLLIGFKPGYRSSWQTALGAIPKQTVIPNTEAWVGDHCIASHFVPGVLLSNRKSKLADPQLADLTVTLLEEFSAPRADGMIGRNIY